VVRVRTLDLPAPAKLNLFLHVTGRRADGYHLLETLFQFLDRADRVRLTLTDDPGVRRSAPVPGVEEDQDLSVRAGRLLASRHGAPCGVDITVHKRLPMGGGLGGGSSDAASVLVGLNRLWGLGLDASTLAALGLELGADVPVFVHGHAALARGVGERLQPVDLPSSWYLVLCPPVHVSTAAVFGATSLTRDTEPLKIEGFPWDLDTQAGLGRFLARTRNDCESVVRRSESAVAAAMEWLATVAPARMTGTGGCVFARFGEAKQARQALACAPAGFDAFVARGVNRSPLLDAVQGIGGRNDGG